jgi:hypothetical protein
VNFEVEAALMRTDVGWSLVGLDYENGPFADRNLF